MPAGPSEITNAEMALFCRQFGSLVHAEVNILQVLESLKAQTEKPYFREVLDAIRCDLEMGRPLATAFSRYPQSFSPFFISMVRQGELEGELDKAFMMLAEHFETRMGSQVEAGRTREAGVFDMQSAMSVLNHFFVWAVAIVSVILIAVAGIWSAGNVGVLSREWLLPTALLASGVILFLLVLLLSRRTR
jgi:hypothetical protein